MREDAKKSRYTIREDARTRSWEANKAMGRWSHRPVVVKSALLREITLCIFPLLLQVPHMVKTRIYQDCFRGCRWLCHDTSHS